MTEATQEEKGHTNLIMKPTRDARLVGNNLFESDNDLESFDQFDRLRESSEPLDILRLERLIEERMYIISNRLIQST